MKRYTPLLLSAALLVSGAAFASNVNVQMPTNCQDYVVHQDMTAAFFAKKNVGQVLAIAKQPNCKVTQVDNNSDSATVTFTSNGNTLRCVNVGMVGVIGADCYTS